MEDMEQNIVCGQEEAFDYACYAPHIRVRIEAVEARVSAIYDCKTEPGEGDYGIVYILNVMQYISRTIHVVPAVIRSLRRIYVTSVADPNTDVVNLINVLEEVNQNCAMVDKEGNILEIADDLNLRNRAWDVAERKFVQLAIDMYVLVLP
ncbi:hypothetical protein MMC25_007858 [Agyrium rufum]|nr:hypothetical protein [Agyrium rufum]